MGTTYPLDKEAYMKVGVLKEIKIRENRVAMTPAGVEQMAAAGHQVRGVAEHPRAAQHLQEALGALVEELGRRAVLDA